MMLNKFWFQERLARVRKRAPALRKDWHALGNAHQRWGRLLRVGKRATVVVGKRAPALKNTLLLVGIQL